MPGHRANCPYAFAPNPSVRMLTLVRVIVAGMDVVINILCLSRLSSRGCGCKRDIKEKDNSTRELEKDFAEHCRLRKT